MLAEKAAVARRARRLGVDDRRRLFDRERGNVRSLGQSRIDLAPGEIGAETPGFQGNGAALRMIADRADFAAAAETAPSGLFGHDEVDGAIAADFQHILVLGQIGVGLFVLDIGAIAADAGEDRLAAFWMFRHFARQRQQRQRLFQRHILGLYIGGKRRAFRLVALALLDIGAEAAVAQSDFLPRSRVFAQNFDAGTLALDALGGALAPVGQGAGEFAIGIIGTADEGAEFAEL